MGLRKAAEIH